MPDDLTTPDALEVIDLPAPNEGEDGTLAMEAVANTAIARWYAVQVASSCEKKVKATLEQRAVTLGVSNRILEIEIPQTPAIKLKKEGSRQSTEEKVFPGYVLVRMVLDEDTAKALELLVEYDYIAHWIAGKMCAFFSHFSVLLQES